MMPSVRLLRPVLVVLLGAGANDADVTGALVEVADVEAGAVDAPLKVKCTAPIIG